MSDDDVNLGQMLDLATPWCLHAAATWRIPEHIAAEHRDIGELASHAVPRRNRHPRY
jgi:hypothetical protein